MKIPPQTVTKKVKNEESIPKDYLENNLQKTTEQVGETMRMTVVRKAKFSLYMCIDILFNFVNYNLGWNLLLLRMMSTQLEVISYCYLNIVHLAKSTSMLVGLFLIKVILALYGVIGYYLLRGGMLGYHIVKRGNMNNLAVKEEKGSIV